MASIAQKFPTHPALHGPRSGSALQKAAPYALWCGVALLSISGVLGRGATAAWTQGLILAPLLLAGLAIALPRLTSVRTFALSVDDTLAGLFALLSLHVALRYTGGFATDLYPLIYALLAYLVAVNERRVGILIMGAALFLEVATFAAGTSILDGPHDLARLLMRVGFMLTFATLYAVFHQAVLLRTRREAKTARLEADKRTLVRSDEMQLSHVATTVGLEREQERRQVIADAVAACERSSYHTLSVVKHGLHARTAVLLWLSEGGDHLTVRELVSDSDHIQEMPIPAGRGVLGGIVQRGEAVRLDSVRQASRTIPYYRQGERVGAFLGVPVIDGDELRGVLCVDRESRDAFGEKDEHMLIEAAEQIVRTLVNERLFVQSEHTRYELSRFNEASRTLAKATGLDAVSDIALETISSIAPFDIAALTLYDQATGEHVVTKVRGGRVQHLEGTRFASNRGLVSAVVRMQHYLPAGGDFREERSVVFDSDTRLKGIRSLLVLPLVVQGEIIGTTVVGTQRPNAFPVARRQILEAITNHLAVALRNAQSFAHMEELATTDGLTRLLNRRTFLERMDDGLARAKRAGTSTTLILTDIDFFKKVNDSYGHPVGDDVLRAVSDVFAQTVRRTDAAGRYGGEEFVILLEDTGLEGGLLMAERLRKAVEDLRFPNEKGEFGVTISLGIASYPEDAPEKHQLIEAADQALYACKENGRNKALAWSRLPA